MIIAQWWISCLSQIPELRQDCFHDILVHFLCLISNLRESTRHLQWFSLFCHDSENLKRCKIKNDTGASGHADYYRFGFLHFLVGYTSLFFADSDLSNLSKRVFWLRVYYMFISLCVSFHSPLRVPNMPYSPLDRIVRIICLQYLRNIFLRITLFSLFLQALYSILFLGAH